MNDTQKIDRIYKKISGFADTDPQGIKPYYLEPLSPYMLDVHDIYLYMKGLPTTAPARTVGQQYDMLGNPVISNGTIQYVSETMTQVSDRPESFYLSGGGRIVPFTIRNGAYAPIFKDQDGHVIYFGTNDMVFDADGGILVFYGGLPDGVTSVTFEGFRYIGLYASDFVAANRPTDYLSVQLASDNLASGVVHNIDLSFTFTHSLGTLNYEVEVFYNGRYVIPSFSPLSNSITVFFDTDILQSDNVVLKITITH